MFKIVKCRGVLLKAMSKYTQQMALLAFFLFTIPLTMICLLNPSESIIFRISAFILSWYMISLFLLNIVEYDNGNLGKIITLPMFISLKSSVLIFKFFLKKKYPEMEDEHYQRWVKLKRLKQKINKKHFIIWKK